MPRAGLDTAAVVDAAATIADAEGLEAVTLARLAAALGVRPPSLYAHVEGVEDLRRRLGARGARQLADALSRAAAGRAGTDALEAVADAYRAYARAHPGSYAAAQRARELGKSDDALAAAGAVVEVVLAVLRDTDSRARTPSTPPARSERRCTGSSCSRRSTGSRSTSRSTRPFGG